MHEGSKKAVIAAFLANLGIAIAKFIGFAITSSASMLAEAIHSVADTGNQGLLFLGAKQSEKRATPEHPFGFGRVRYFWAFIVALVLFSLGGLFAIYEGVNKLRHPHEMESPAVAFAILIVAAGLEGWSLRTATKESNLVRKESWWSFIRHSRTPELPVVLLEDFGALTGLVFALAGVSLTVITGDPMWDGLGSLVIGVLLVVIAIVLAIEMQSLLIGESARPEVVGEIRAAAERGPNVRKLIHMRTEHLGPEELLVAAKVDFDPSLTVAELADAIDDVEKRIRADVPIAKLIYLEPDLYEVGGQERKDRDE